MFKLSKREEENIFFKMIKNKINKVNKFVLVKMNKVKKLTAIILAALLVFTQSATVILAIDSPAAPESPSSPESPAAPESPSSPEAPSAPESISSPTEPESTTSTNSSGSDEEEEEEDNHNHDEEEEEENSSEEAGATSDTTQSSGSSDSSSSGSGDQTADNQVGDPEITTGDATSTAVVSTSGNNNYSGATPSSDSGSGVSVINDGNGTGSNNTGSASLSSTDTTNQSNSANIVNNLYQETETGDNSASRNVGTSTITTGDANTTGTLITAVNTNVDGVAVYEFNVADDQTGDIILDYGSNCISGCLPNNTSVINSGNGADSTNEAEVETAVNSYTFQNNDAVVTNNMILDADSGNNETDRNTGGDSTIVTGDANVAANALTFANNNLSGAVIYSVVNIFGDLVGDIIFPDGFCCFNNVSAQNTGNGADSTNTADVDLTNTDLTYQFNSADIQNNLIIYANTGENDTSKNTGGNSKIVTGEASVEAQVVNIANTNISGGDWWLVIVNEAGNWVGKIIGAPTGALFAGSLGFDIYENELGEIFVSNSGNGAGSTNTSEVSQDVNNTTVQMNTANIVNNLDISANTGGNSASRNTAGDSSITTGDADVIANIVNFVNNNFAGGRLFVNVINVFGSWLGDFVGPGQEQESQAQANAQADNGVGGASGSSSSSSSSSGNNSNSQTQGAIPQTQAPVPTITFNVGTLIASAIVDAAQDGSNSNNVLSLSESGDASQTAGESVVNINLAWLIFLIPAYFVLMIVRKRKRLFRLLPLRR